MLDLSEPMVLDGGAVSCEPYAPGLGLPLFITPVAPHLQRDGDVAAAWVTDNRAQLDALLLQHGAFVLRGFPVAGTEDFNRMIESYPSASMDYTAGATPRAPIAGRIYEATRTPADYWIGLHQEMSYLPRYPSRLAFYCRVPPETGGETVIADIRRFEAEMPPHIREAVAKRGVRYTRSFRDPKSTCGHERLDRAHKDWADGFDTQDPDVAERKARAMGLETRWLDDGSLETAYLSRGMAEHPRTGQTIWFNQLTTQYMCHENLGPRSELWRTYYTERGRPLPYHSTYGDGAEIAAEDRSALYALFDRIMVAFSWQHGDVMVLDNFLTAHGRNPYTGDRDVQVALLD